MKTLFRFSLCYLLFAFGACLSGRAESAPAGPANGTILMIRHAEKPESGDQLSEAGQKRAQAYPGYFQKLEIDGKSVHLDFLIATKDSDNSQRPKLTIQPLSMALHLPLETDFKNKEFGVLADKLKTAMYHGKTILVSWHHGHIPDFVSALGGDPAKLFPNGKWPENVFSWIVVLHYDERGQLKNSSVVSENLMPGDAELVPTAAK